MGSRSHAVLSLLLLIELLLVGCHSEERVDTSDSPSLSAEDISAQSGELEEGPSEPEPEPEWEWMFDTPEHHGLSQTGVDALHTALDPTDVRAAVIVKDGVIVDEYYKDGFDETSVFTLQSVSKSLTSAIMGIAIEKGYIESIDEPISKYLPQVLDIDSERFQRVTIRHLLTHTSGIDFGDNAVWGPWRSSDNWTDYALNRPLIHEPGTVFNYATAGSHLLAAILQEATGMTAYDFGKEYLFDPLGMDSVVCALAPEGISDGGNGFAMNVRDMAKFGQLFLQRGQWEGEQIIPEDWVEESTTVQFTRSSGLSDYGYQWWVRTFGQQRYPAFFAQGHFGQFIFVIPDLELVIVFTSHNTGSNSMYWQFVSDIVAACKE